MPTERKMETQFYEDAPNGLWLNKKKSMTLNFDIKSNKKSVLSTPDVQMLQLASPELEKIINQQGNICTTPTPTQFICPKNVTDEQSAFAQGFVEALQSLHESGTDHISASQVLQQVNACTVIDPRVTISVQEDVPVTTSVTNLSCATTCYDPVLTSATTLPGSTENLPIYSTSYSTAYSASPSPESINSVPHTGWTTEPQHHMEAMSLTMPRIKVEPGTISEPPQTVPVFHGAASVHQQQQCLDLSPIDMETQERIKSERKRLRNRIAASKCRKRKLERISRLEDKVQDLKNQNSDLQTAATKLREQVCKLKEGVMEHVKCGCQVMLAQQLAF